MTILLLSHDLDYSCWLREAVSDGYPHVDLKLVRSEQEAAQYLEGVGVHENRFCSPVPDVVLVDMAHPHGDHLAILSLLGSDSYLTMPVVLLSSTAAQQQVKHAFHREANSFVAKRKDSRELKNVLDSIQHMKAHWEHP